MGLGGYYLDKGGKESPNELLSNGGVCRTAPATWVC